MGSTERRLGVYLLSFTQAVTILFHVLIHGGSHDPSLKPFLCRSSSLARCCCITADERNFNAQTPSIDRTLHLAVMSLLFSWELR